MKRSSSQKAVWPLPYKDIKNKPGSVSADVAKYAAVREVTGAPMVVCKNALKAAGNLDDAVKLLFILGQCDKTKRGGFVEEALGIEVAPAQAMLVRESIKVPTVYVKRALQLCRGDVAATIKLLHRLMPLAGDVLDGLPVANRESSSARSLVASGCEEFQTALPVGGHLVSPRGAYNHHGIHIGQGRVIHYSGLANGLKSGPIEEVSLAAFQACNDLFLIEHPSPKFSAADVVRRARSRLNEAGYSVFSNNCEHFCNWCIDGDHRSMQVDVGTAGGATGGGIVSGIVARAVVSSSGVVVGTSGAGVMSGLASTGALVGSGAVAGIGVLAGGPALAMASLVNSTVLADSEHLDQDERSARSIGRKATYAGAAGGVAGSLVSVSAAGTVGLSGAGITSGLAAIGGSVGGGMAAGTVIVTAAPVAAAALVGVGVYKIVKFFKS